MTNRVFVSAFVALAVAGGAWLLVQSPWLEVGTIEVRGARQRGPEAVLAATAGEVGEPLLLADLHAIEARVETVAWVAEAHVSRRLPDTLRIRVEERVPRSWARAASGTVALVDSTGRVVGVADEAPSAPALPELLGLESVPGVGEDVHPRAAAGVYEQLPPALAGRVTHLVVSADDVALRLVDGPEIRLGRPVDVASKGVAALAVLDALAGAPSEVAYVDVSVPEAPVTG